MKTVEECEREFAAAVQHFVDVATAAGYSLEEAKAMARDEVARGSEAVQGGERRVIIPIRRAGSVFPRHAGSYCRAYGS